MNIYIHSTHQIMSIVEHYFTNKVITFSAYEEDKIYTKDDFKLLIYVNGVYPNSSKIPTTSFNAAINVEPPTEKPSVSYLFNMFVSIIERLILYLGNSSNLSVDINKEIAIDFLQSILDEVSTGFIETNNKIDKLVKNITEDKSLIIKEYNDRQVSIYSSCKLLADTGPVSFTIEHIPEQDKIIINKHWLEIPANAYKFSLVSPRGSSSKRLKSIVAKNNLQAGVYLLDVMESNEDVLTFIKA